MKPAKAKKAGKGAATKYKKAPDAPKRFKSAFIIFSAEKHKEIKAGLLEDGKAVKTTEIAKLVSEQWKNLDPEERKIWDEKAEKDKLRYEAEKAIYKGPWKIPSNKRKAKDPSAPKRPMSAFLAYSNSRRAKLKQEHPKSTNADLSRMLSKTWKELDPQTRAEYMAEERKLRDIYKEAMTEWRKKCAEQKKVEREERELAAMEAAEAGPPMDPVDPSPPQMDNKWMGMQQPQPGQGDMQNPYQQQQNQHDQQQQLNEMANAQMFSNPYLAQAAAFGGAGVGQGMDARAAALGLNAGAPQGNPYLANALAGQGYMQGMQGMHGMPGGGAGNPALSLFGAQSYMQNAAGMHGQLHSGLYGGNFGGGMPGMNGNEGGQAPGAYGQMQP